MSTKEKLIQRFLSMPNGFTCDELVQFLQYFGYSEDMTGKTSGSAVRFTREDLL